MNTFSYSLVTGRSKARTIDSFTHVHRVCRMEFYRGISCPATRLNLSKSRMKNIVFRPIGPIPLAFNRYFLVQGLTGGISITSLVSFTSSRDSCSAFYGKLMMSTARIGGNRFSVGPCRARLIDKPRGIRFEGPVASVKIWGGGDPRVLNPLKYPFTTYDHQVTELAFRKNCYS